MGINNKQVNFTREQLIVHKHKRNSILYFVYGIFRLLGIIVENIYCVSSYLILSWILLLPISWFKSDLYSKLENHLYNSLLFIVSSWSLAAGSLVVETGENYKSLIEDPQQQVNNLVMTSASKENGLDNSKTVTKISYTKVHGDINLLNNTLTTITTSEAITHTTAISTPIPSHKEINSNSKISALNSSEANPGGDDGQIAAPTTNDLNGLRNSSMLDSEHDVIAKPRILMLCNHISTADVPLIMQSFSTLTKQSLLWVLDAQFKPTNFGLVSWSHDDFFITKNKFTDGSLRDHVLKHPDRNLLILFPEGGFWRKRLEGSNRYATKNGLPHTKYVTHPRFGAFKDLVDPSLNVTHIVDTTLLYDDIRKPLSILDIALGTRKEPVILNYKIFNRNSVNLNEEWLRNLWLEKDKLLQRYYHNRNNVYDQIQDTLRSIQINWVRVIVVHLFYLLVFYMIVYKLVNN